MLSVSGGWRGSVDLTIYAGLLSSLIAILFETGVCHLTDASLTQCVCVCVCHYNYFNVYLVKFEREISKNRVFAEYNAKSFINY